MKSIKLVLVLAMVALLVVAGASVASAAGGKWGNGVENQKSSLYPVPSGDSSNAVVGDVTQGKVIVVNPMGGTTMVIQGNATGLVAGKTYQVWVRDLGGSFLTNLYEGSADVEAIGYFKLTSFVADEFGNGNFHLNLPADLVPDGTYTIQVAINCIDSGDPDYGHTVIATPWGANALTVEINSKPD